MALYQVSKMVCVCDWDGRDKECIQHISEVTPWKSSSWKIEKETWSKNKDSLGNYGIWSSSVSIVSECRMDDCGSIAGRGEGFFLSSLCPDQFWGPLSFLSSGYRGSFPVGNARPGRDAHHSPHLVPRSRICRSYKSSPPWRVHGGDGTVFSLW
jgi:hypothetical protein